MQGHERKDRQGRGAEAESVFRKFQHTMPFRLLVRGFLTATRYLPVWALRCAGLFFVVLFILFNHKNYNAIKDNLSRIRPGLSRLRYSVMAFSVFMHYAYYLIDLFYLSHDPGRAGEYAISLHGFDHLETAVSGGKGVVLLTSHLGNWEIGGLKLSSLSRDFIEEIHVVYSPDSLNLLERQRSLIRHAERIREIPLKEGEFSSLKLLRLLREGKVIALQGDRLLFDRGIKTQFFGSEALLPKGPVKLAIASDSIIIPVFIPITGYKSYEMIIEEPVQIERNTDPDAEVRTNLDRIIKILERYIGQYPSQWYTFMPFWLDDSQINR